MREHSDEPVVILGGGLAGLSLGCALVEAMPGRPLMIIDRRHTWTRDRTWCTWQAEPLRFDSCITHRWPAWRICAGERSVLAHSRRHPYVHLDAQLVYESALERLGAAGVEIRAGEAVLEVSPGPRPQITTSRESLDAALVFDGMGPAGPLGPAYRPGDGDLTQRFLGWEVQSDRPVFDPGVATLMEFVDHRGPGVSFLYTLAFSPTRALVEHTSIEPADRPDYPRESFLDAHLRGLGLDAWQVHRSELGAIPMSGQNFPTQRGQNVVVIGTGAGAVRPSSGYAFTRIQRQASQIAAAMARGAPPPTPPSRPRHAWMDRIFLRALARAAEPEDLFLRMGAVPGDVFARFMTDSSSVGDEVRLMAALPPLEMLRSAGPEWLDRLPGRGQPTAQRRSRRPAKRS